MPTQKAAPGFPGVVLAVRKPRTLPDRPHADPAPPEPFSCSCDGKLEHLIHEPVNIIAIEF